MNSASNFVGQLLNVKPRSGFFYCAVLLLGLAWLPSRSFAQTGTIVGTVTDRTGAVVPNVSVTITNTDTARTITMPTNDAGQYVAPDLPVGKYNVKVERLIMPLCRFTPYPCRST